MSGREALLWGRPMPPKDDAPRRSILHCLRMLAPFREAIPACGHAGSDMAEGERQPPPGRAVGGPGRAGGKGVWLGGSPESEELWGRRRQG